MIPALSVTANATTGYDRGYTGCFDGDGKIYALGLDCAQWQGDSVDFNAIKAAGYSYVILRCGTSKSKDNLFETYYSQAKAAGLDVGTYFYSYATTADEACTDATTTLSYIADKKFEYPVYLDYEESSQTELDPSIQLSIMREYLSAIKNAGYLTGLYSFSHIFNQSWFKDSEIPDIYEGWHVQISPDGNYESMTEDVGNTYGMLQYSWTHSFTVNGQTYGEYDANVCYKDYPKIVKTYEFNGYATHSHQWDNGVATKEVTCTENGELTYSCLGCDETYIETIEATGHSAKTVGAKKATYFAKGYTGDKVCKHCKKTISKGKNIAKLKLKTPTVKVTGGKKKITVKYTKVTGAKGFEVKYKIGKKIVTKTFEAKTNVTKTINKLAKGNYKVQVRAFVKQSSKTAYSSWTKATKVKVK